MAQKRDMNWAEPSLSKVAHYRIMLFHDTDSDLQAEKSLRSHTQCNMKAAVLNKILPLKKIREVA